MTVDKVSFVWLTMCTVLLYNYHNYRLQLLVLLIVGSLSEVKFKIESQPAVKIVPMLSKRGSEPPLPRPFTLPINFPHAILEGLNQAKLCGKPRTKFITIISQSIYRFKSYPTDDEYVHVAQELAKKWPFLDEGKGIVSSDVAREFTFYHSCFQSIQRYLVVAMKMRMAYLRKPDSKK